MCDFCLGGAAELAERMEESTGGSVEELLERWRELERRQARQLELAAQVGFVAVFVNIAVFINRGTESLSKFVIKRSNGSTKRPCDQIILRAGRGAGAAGGA